MNKEITKTSLLIIAGILTASGAATIADSTITGLVLLSAAVVVLIIRGVLKAKGIALKSTSTNNENI